MTNREIYAFDSFTLDNYRNLLRLAVSNRFEFLRFTDVYVEQRKDIIWRHDVEFSPDIALTMAKEESELGIHATYFFQLHSEFYNILEKWFTDVLQEIRSLGHSIGLHFDAHYYNITSTEELNQFIHIDREYFEKVFRVKVDVFSFHNTTPFLLTCNDFKYGGLINVYSSFFRTKYRYCADSTGYWRYEVLDDVLRDPSVKHLQVLIHDAMWTEDVLSPRQRVMKSIQDNAERVKKQYDFILAAFGANNIDD